MTRTPLSVPLDARDAAMSPLILCYPRCLGGRGGMGGGYAASSTNSRSRAINHSLSSGVNAPYSEREPAWKVKHERHHHRHHHHHHNK